MTNSAGAGSIISLISDMVVMIVEFVFSKRVLLDSDCFLVFRTQSQVSRVINCRYMRLNVTA
jgi:hypothetical protein